MKKYLEAGKFLNTHGVAGLLRAEQWCDSTEVLCSLGTVYVKRGGEFIPVKVERSSPHKQFVLMKLEGCDSIDSALKYKNQLFYADRDDIPRSDGAFFIADLIGLDVIDADTGRVYGKITDVYNRGASDIYEIDVGEGTVLFPAAKEFVDRVDADAGVYIRPIAGMFTPAEEIRAGEPDPDGEDS